MKLTDEDLREFRELWKPEFDEEITVEYARARASQLIELYAFLYGPDEPATVSASPQVEQLLQKHEGIHPVQKIERGRGSAGSFH